MVDPYFIGGHALIPFMVAAVEEFGYDNFTDGFAINNPDIETTNGAAIDTIDIGER